MAQPMAKTSLSLAARLALYLGPPATILLVSAGSPKAGLLTPLAFLPAAGLYKAYSRSTAEESDRRANLEPLIWTTLISATAGVGIATFVQFVTGYGTATALFGNGETRDFFVLEAMRASLDGLSSDDIARRAVLASSWQTTAFNAAFSFVGAALTEESLKYLPVAYSRQSLKTADSRSQRRTRASLDYALAWGLGLGLVETVGGVYTAVTDPQSTWPQITLTIFERLILGASAHLITAALSSLRSIKRDLDSKEPGSGRDLITILSIIAPATFFHGANNFGLFSFSAWNGNIGFIHPTEIGQGVAMLAMYLTALGSTAWLARREWKAIQQAEKKDI